MAGRVSLCLSGWLAGWVEVGSACEELKRGDSDAAVENGGEERLGVRLLTSVKENVCDRRMREMRLWGKEK